MHPLRNRDRGTLVTDAAQEVRKALAFWAHHMISTGQVIPSGYAEAARSLVAAADGPPAWLTPAEAARRARVSTRTIRRWRSQGLASARIGAVTLVRTTDLDEFVAHGGHHQDVDTTVIDTRSG